eukprot:6476095-Amphidinium_carterae.1
MCSREVLCSWDVFSWQLALGCMKHCALRREDGAWKGFSQVSIGEATTGSGCRQLPGNRHHPMNA